MTNTSLPVLVVRATGSLGGKVVDELLKRDKNLRVLIAPTSTPSLLQRGSSEPGAIGAM